MCHKIMKNSFFMCMNSAQRTVWKLGEQDPLPAISASVGPLDREECTLLVIKGLIKF